MGIFADSLFTVLMSWVRALVSGIWALFTSDQTTLLGFLGEHWLMIAIVIVAAGLVIDWLVWLVRWQPYQIWGMRVRRLLGKPAEQDGEEEEAPKRKATAAKKPRKPAPQPEQPAYAAGAAQEAYARHAQQRNWLPLESPNADERELQRAMEQAERVPDEQLGAYPGMRYGTQAPQSVDDDTRTFSAVHSEGPGAAEVNRRRAEIDAWRQQMEEEARAKAAQQARLAQQAKEAEQARLAQQAKEAEQARLAKEAEQARAQQEYERQLAEYERQKAQYERDMEVYRRQKAAYDAEMARRQSAQQAAQNAQQAAQSAQDYSAYVPGETVQELPDAPQWPQMQQPERAPAPKKKKPKKEKKENALLNRVAKMLETDEEEIGSINALPPRVSAQDAYHPATRPQERSTRGK